MRGARQGHVHGLGPVGPSLGSVDSGTTSRARESSLQVRRVSSACRLSVSYSLILKHTFDPAGDSITDIPQLLERHKRSISTQVERSGEIGHRKTATDIGGYRPSHAGPHQRVRSFVEFPDGR